MKRFLLLSLLFVACKKSSTNSNDANVQVTYEVKTTGVSSWTGGYLDATSSFTLLQSQTSSNWSFNFKNEIPSARYLSMQIMEVNPSNPLSPITAIATIYVNGKIVKTDSVNGYVEQITPPFVQYLLQ